MTSRELEYIKTVADEKSISAAARKLYIAQPSLSQSLQRIEENLDAHLFNRTPSGLTLTYAGKRCYQMACQVLKIYSDFETEISDIKQLKSGRIVMGTTNHLGTVILPKILPEFKTNSLLNWISAKIILESWKNRYLQVLWILPCSMLQSWRQIHYWIMNFYQKTPL